MSYKLIGSEKFHSMQATVETVVFDDDVTVKRLVSYDSVVCDVRLDIGRIFFYPRYQYSSTTIRQVTRFLNEHVPLAERWNIGLVRELQKRAYNDGFVFFGAYTVLFLPQVIGTTRRW